MPRIKRFNRKKFQGNQHSLPVPTPGNDLGIGLGPTSEPKKSSSSKKLHGSKLPKVYEYDNNDVNIIINMEVLSASLKSFSRCKECSSDDCMILRLDETYTNGLAHKLIFECSSCSYSNTFMSSNTFRNKHEVNLRFSYAMRSIGKGLEAGKTFSAVMNLAPPNSRMQTLYKQILPSLTDVCNASLRNAASEAVQENEGSPDIAAAFDGTWQKRGFKSLNGVITVTSFDTGKVLDYYCMSKFCINCARGLYKDDPVKLEQHRKECKANYTGTSGGMEVEGAKAVCLRSEDKLGVRYVKYLGDGDSKGFQSVLEARPYGEDVDITKLECVGHVQKRLGSRLRTLKKKMKGVELADGKTLAGKGRLTDPEIDNLQRYYGMAIRSSLTDATGMKNAVWATYYHKLSTDQNPQHHLCPKGENTWCKFNKSLITKSPFTHNKSLPEAVMEAIKPIYKDLSAEGLLRRCLHGKTQNPNESVNSCIWKILPKTEFVGLNTLQFGVADAILCFNEGSIAKANVLKHMGLKPGKFMVEGLKTIDQRRIVKADKEYLEQNKKKRVRRRLVKKATEENEKEEEDYFPGGF